MHPWLQKLTAAYRAGHAPIYAGREQPVVTDGDTSRRQRQRRGLYIGLPVG